MKQSILLISKNYDLSIYLKSTLNHDLIMTSTSDMMQNCFMLSPIYIFVDTDIVNYQVLQVIKSIQEIDFIPVLYIGRKTDILFDELVVPSDINSHELNLLVLQGEKFKKQYNKVSQAYETMDALTTDTKGILSRLVDEEIDNKSEFYFEIVNNVFEDNMILSNKPMFLWLIEKFRDEYVCYMLEKANDKYYASYSCNIEDTFGFGFDIFSENGFSIDFSDDQVSDIDKNSKLFPDELSQKINEISNFAGYGMDQIILMGCNYEHNVTSYEASVLKSTVVTLDLLKTIRFQINEIESSFNYTLDALARAAEASDDLTGKHIKRVNAYAKYLAYELGYDLRFIKSINNSAQMHDVGKIYVDNQILKKPGALTELEFEEMKKHTIYGEKIIGNSEYMSMAAEIALNHHEKYDGTGYPNGKSGEEIPISARIVSLADVYDALRSPRPYKEGFSHEKAYEIIVNGDGRVMPTHFDPKLIEIFIKNHEEFRRIFDSLK